MAVLGYFPKLKRGLELTFGAHYLHDFLVKMFLIQYSFKCHAFFPGPVKWRDTVYGVIFRKLMLLIVTPLTVPIILKTEFWRVSR